MKKGNRKASIKVRFIALCIAMLIVTPGGAMQSKQSFNASALINTQTADEITKEKIPVRTTVRKARDCSLGIPCKRKPVNYRIERKQAIALAVMMGLGAKARIH